MPDWNSFNAFLTEALQVSPGERQELVDTLLSQRPAWPWIEGTKATFVYAKSDTENVALNLDTIKSDPPFAPMSHLEGTTLWYLTREFEPDDLLDYLLAVNDPMTPLAQEKDIVGRVSRHWHTDPLNPHRIDSGQAHVSVLQMPEARPFPDWSAMPAVPRGQVIEHEIDSRQLNLKGRKLWVYTPPGYAQAVSKDYPLLILQDGQWCTGPLQVPYIADALIKHNRMEPIVIAMIQSGSQEEKPREFISNDRYYLFMLMELLPYVQTHYRIDPIRMGTGGVAIGAVAAAHAALMNPTAFSHLIMISPPLGKGPNQDQLQRYANRFETAETLPKRIFQSVGRYEAGSRFLKPGRELRDILEKRRDVDYRFIELGSGHGLVGFKGALPEALAWVFPGELG
jgi:enterochelin esterase-like enzyme